MQSSDEPLPANFPPLWQRLLFGGSAGAILAAGFPPYKLPYLLPLGIALLLFALRDDSHGKKPTLRDSAYIGLACGMVYFGGTLFWLVNLFGAAALSLCVITAVFPMLFAVGYTFLRGRTPLPDWFLAALVWTACEYFRSESFVLNFGWVGLGYGVINFPLFATIASWVGSYGITFVVVTFGGLLLPPRKVALTGQIARQNSPRWAGIAIVVIYLALCLLPRPLPPLRNPLHVRLVQAFSDDTDSFFALTKPQKSEPTDVIVLPEYAFLEDPIKNRKLWHRLQQTAESNQAYLIFGAKDQFDTTDDAHFRNTAFVLSSKGELIGRHVKNHPVHFLRDGVAGSHADAIPTSLGRLGVAICFDMDYPDVARRLVADGATVFLIPNNDPAEWGQIQRGQHRLMFQMRAAECGRWVARADVAGGTSLCAPNGQETEHVTTSDPIKLDVIAGRSSYQTVYVRGGWRFGQICFWLLLGLIVVLVYRVVLRGKANRA